MHRGYASQRSVAFIDFDAAALGSRVFDIGHAAWLWLDLGNADYAAAEQRRRLGVFLTGYGINLRDADIIAAIIERQSIVIAQGIATSKTAMRDWALACREWVLNTARL